MESNAAIWRPCGQNYLFLKVGCICWSKIPKFLIKYFWSMWFLFFKQIFERQHLTVCEKGHLQIFLTYSLETIHFLKFFNEKWAQSDVSKEMWVHCFIVCVHVYKKFQALIGTSFSQRHCHASFSWNSSQCIWLNFVNHQTDSEI